MVFDFGGGTLDVTILEMGWDEENKAGTFEVLATSGDNQLGGTDMDNALIDYIAEEFKKENGIDLRNDKMAFNRIREAAEKAKVELSSTISTDINLPFVTADAAGPKHLTMAIDRAKLESLVSPIIDRCRGPIKQAITDASDKVGEKFKIDRIILVGGPTRMPIVQQFVEKEIGQKIERGVDPMECVALGAAIQAGIIKGETKEVLLLDVTPLSLGIETEGGLFTKLIERNTTIPTKKSELFSTASENQTAVTVRVLQGEREMAKDNTELGRFDLIGIPSAPRGVPQIEVTFDIDSDGIVHVSAKDKGTGKEQSIRITAPTKLSQDDIDRMVKEAEKFASEDKIQREITEVVNQGNSLVYTTEKSLKDYGDKVPKKDKEQIEKELEKLKDAIQSKDVANIKQAMDALTKVSYKLAEQIYQTSSKSDKEHAKASSNTAKGSKASTTQKMNKDDDIIDADFKASDE